MYIKFSQDLKIDNGEIVIPKGCRIELFDDESWTELTFSKDKSYKIELCKSK